MQKYACLGSSDGRQYGERCSLCIRIRVGSWWPAVFAKLLFDKLDVLTTVQFWAGMGREEALYFKAQIPLPVPAPPPSTYPSIPALLKIWPVETPGLCFLPAVRLAGPPACPSANTQLTPHFPFTLAFFASAGEQWPGPGDRNRAWHT